MTPGPNAASTLNRIRTSVRHRTYSASPSLQYCPRMDTALSERIQELCARIANEHDRNKFLKLCEELNRLLSSRDRPLTNDEKTPGP